MTALIVPVGEARRRLHDGGEIALLDIREAGQFGEAHPLFATPCPYSRLEILAPRLVPRRTARVLLLDEPFSALDAAVKKELLDEVKGHVEKAKVPALLVTHDTTEARALGERVLFIEKGRLARSATISESDF